MPINQDIGHAGSNIVFRAAAEKTNTYFSLSLHWSKVRCDCLAYPAIPIGYQDFIMNLLNATCFDAFLAQRNGAPSFNNWLRVTLRTSAPPAFVCAVNT